MYHKFLLAAYLLYCMNASAVDLTTPALSSHEEGRVRLSFNDGWTFHRGDAPAAFSPDFTAGDWKAVRIPHDWAIEGPFSDEFNARTGGLPVHGIGWYRKAFTVSPETQGKVTTIEFDGVMNNAEVWINGTYLGKRPYGYVGFEYDLTDLLDYDGPNLIAVKVAPENFASRWYSGAGIYRNVWLETKGPVHVAHWGTAVTTPAVSDAEATVRTATTVVNAFAKDVSVTVESTIIDPAGREVARTESDLKVGAEGRAEVEQEVTVTRPLRWDLERPLLYTLRQIIRKGDEVMDTVVSRFGIRTIEFTADEGFLLNGRQVRLNGVCLHHDLGALGAAVNYRATERQLQIMKDMGVNAVRTSHNPPSPEQVALCDQMGILLQVEAFDVWRIAKVENGYNRDFDQWHERDLRDMIRRDRNSPSVIMWSIGNEILEQNEPDGAVITGQLAAMARDEDPTRPVTAGFNYHPGPYENGMAEAVDLVGMNYKPVLYARMKAAHPDWIIYGSETSSCTSSRGTYHLPIEKYARHESLQVTSYDLIGPPWAYPPDVEFDCLEKNPSILGEFIWTGFDYLGEPTPYGGRDNSTDGYWNADWPARSSYFGAVDLAGFPKDRFYLYQSQWTTEPMVHLLPHWNWEGHEGETIPVYVYTNCDEAELIVNGESLGRRKRWAETTELLVKFNNYEGDTFSSKYRMRWDVPYASGAIEVIGFRNGKVAARKTIRTAGPAAAIGLEPDRSTIAGDGLDLCFVTVRIEDAAGVFCPRADNRVHFEISGPGEIAAVDNGNAATTDPFQADWRHAFNGMALVIVRSKAGGTGVITLTARADGLAEKAVEIAVE
jgi:beta-galactosidase